MHEEVLLEGLWPSLGPVAGKRNLQVAASSIRALLEPGRARCMPTMLQRRGESYLLALPEGSDVDVLAFAAATARWRRSPSNTEVAAALEAARADAADAAVALAVYHLAAGWTATATPRGACSSKGATGPGTLPRRTRRGSDTPVRSRS